MQVIEHLVRILNVQEIVSLSSAQYIKGIYSSKKELLIYHWVESKQDTRLGTLLNRWLGVNVFPKERLCSVDYPSILFV